MLRLFIGTPSLYMIYWSSSPVVAVVNVVVLVAVFVVLHATPKCVQQYDFLNSDQALKASFSSLDA
jgi:hypothetical protein